MYRAIMSRLQNSEPQHSGSISSGLQLLSASLHRNSSDAPALERSLFSAVLIGESVFFSLGGETSQIRELLWSSLSKESLG